LDNLGWRRIDMATSSYSNNLEPVMKEEDRVMVDKYDRFHRVPVAVAFDASRDKIAECDRQTGHTLVIKETVGPPWIVCERCGAEWRHYGF
jgi:hypothetical protein